MKIPHIKIITLLILALGVTVTAVGLNMVDLKNSYGFDTGASVTNTIPSITAGPSDGGSSVTTPTNVGNNVTFTATATDVNLNQYYLAVCKTQYVKPGADAAPSCCTDSGLLTCTVAEKWAISTATNSGSPASVNYTASSGDIESNDWYAFVCDKNASGLCSAYSQGSGDTGSPFVVNHAPTFGTLTVTDNSNGEINPGDTLRFKLVHGQFNDTDLSGGQDLVNMYICTSATTSFNYSTNSCTNGSLICSHTGVNPTTTDASCDETGNTLVPPSAVRGTANFKVYFEDSHDLAGTGTNQQSYTIQNTTPTHDNPVLGVHAPILPNSVASWQFEDGTGATSFDDETTNNNNGSCTNCPTWTQSGYSGGAYDFDGTDDYINAGNNSSLDIRDAITISLWVNRRGGNAGDYTEDFIGKRPAASDYMVTGKGNATLYLTLDGVPDLQATSGVPLTNGVWTHLVFTYDSQSGIGKAYKDGAQYGTDITRSGHITSYPSVPVNISSPSYYYVNGLMDEVHIYNRALSTTEISTLYFAYTTPTATSNMDISAKPVNVADHDSDTTTTIYNWKKNGSSIAVLNTPFDSNISSTTTDAVLDYSGNANHGTLGAGTANYAPIWTSNGIMGGAYDFDGTDYIQIDNSATLENITESDFTFEAWYHPDALPSDVSTHNSASIVCKHGYHVTMDYWNDAKFGFTLWNSGNAQFSAFTSQTYPIQNWYHLVFVVATSDRSAKLYVNGQLAAYNNYTGTLKDYGTTSITIGACSLPGEPWDSLANGKIDEVRIYSSALTPQQVAQDYNNGKPTYNTITESMTSASDTSWLADVTINDAQTNYSNSTTKSTNALDPGNAEPVQGTPSARAHAPLDSGSVGYWQMEDGTSATAFDDETTNNNNGSCTNCPTYTAEGAVGGAYTFNGTNNVISVLDSNSLESTDKLTLSSWVKINSLGVHKNVIGKWSQNNLAYILEVSDSDNAYICVSTDCQWSGGNGPSSWCLGGNTDLQTGQWYHIAGIHDGTTMKLYVNGIEDGSRTGPSTICTTGTSQVLIGGNWEVGYLNGAMDEPHIYNRALSATEIKNLYNSNSYVYGTMDIGASARDVSDADSDTTFITTDWRKNGTSAAVLNMSFNKNVTSTTAGAVTDYSSYANNGTLGGGTADYVPTWTNASTCGNNSGGCYSFDGTNDYIEASGTPASGNVSMFAWIYKPLVNPDNCIGGRCGVIEVPSHNLLEVHGGGVDIYGYDWNTPKWVSVGSVVTAGAWHQVGYTYNQSALRIYVDGVDVGGDNNVPGTMSSMGTVRIGAYGGGVDRFFYGKIDDVKIFNRTITPAQVASMYNAGKPNYQNIAYGELSVGDTWKASMTVTDANGNEDGTITSNELEILGFSTVPYEDPESSITSPTNAGSNVVIKATANIASGRQWYLAICKTNAVTAGNNTAPTCDGESWAISSETADTAMATATYLTSSGDAESNIWYAFACDKVASVASCSPVSQGSGDTGSPFYVSQRPVLGTVKIGSECGDTAPTAPGNSKTMKVTNGVWSRDDMILSISFQNDGKIVAGGYSTANESNYWDFAVARYNTDGSLDTSFGSGGKVATALPGSDGRIQSIALQNDGKIVAGGMSSASANKDFAVARYNTDGSLDTSFDGDGIVTTAIGSGEDYGISVAIQNDGKIVLGGYSNNGSNRDFAVARYNTDGSLDTSFDGDASMPGYPGNGKVTTAIGSGEDNAQSMKIQSDGKIILAGWSYNGSNRDFAVVRYNTDGTLDTSFDGDGKVTTAIGSGDDSGASIAIQNDGKIVVSGSSNNGSNNDFALSRYNTDGSLDTSFGTGGKVTTAIGSGSEYSLPVSIQNDGKIVAGGFSNNGSNNDFAAVRYNTDGSLDTTFDTDGKVTTAIGSGNDSGYTMAIQSDGKIIEAGYSSNGTSNNDFALVRYNINGSLDVTFDHDGKRTDSVWSGDDFANTVAIQSDGKMIVAGDSNNGTYDDFALARYNADGSFDNTFDSDGKVITSVGTNNDWASSAVIQSDGKIIAAGQSSNGSNYDFAVVRYTSAGALDTDFDTDGKQTTAVLSGDDYGQSVALQSDGKVLVAGYSHNGTNNDFAVVRYTSAGALDTSFDNDGKVTTPVGSSDDYGSSVLVQTDGKILVSGYSNNGSNNDFAVIRYTSVGALDTGFGSGGKVTTSIGSGNDQAFSSVLQGDGKIVVAGWTWNGSNYDIAVVRYGADGTPDTSFSGDGIVTTAIGSGHDYGNSVIIQSDGKIVVAGSTYAGTNGDFSLVRYNTDGTLDTGFGTGGKASSAVGSDDDYGTSVALQSDGKFVVAGDAKYGSKYDFAIVRFKSDGTVDSLSDYACVQAGISGAGTDTVQMDVCSTNSYTGGVCQGTTLCSISGVKSGNNAQCVMNNEVPVPDAHGAYNVYVFLKNSHGVVDAGTGNEQSYTVADVAPVLTSYTASDSPAPSAGGSYTVDYSVLLSDGNGDNDPTNVKGVLFDSAVVTHDCTASENNCYILPSCTLTGKSTPGSGKTATGTDAALGADCQATVWYNANASSSWKVQAEVTDGIGNTEFIDLLTSITNPALSGINVTQSSISYGAVAVGEVSTLKTSSMENMGNQTIDIMLSGSNMTCSIGLCAGYSIPAAQEQWYHINNDFNWGRNPPTDPGPYPLVTSPSGNSDGTGCLNKDIAVRNVHDNTATNESVYWKLKVPDQQPGGTYTGQNTFAATDASTCSAGQSY